MNQNITYVEDNECQIKVKVLRMSYNYMINYNYMIIDPLSNGAVIVDPAWQIEKVDQALVDEKVNLRGVLITHAHADHIDLADALSKKYDCPIWMSHQEIAISGYSAENLIAIDETTLVIGNMKIQPIWTPGHTMGCFCYLIEDNLFTGDVLFAEGCGMCPNLPAAYTMFESLSKLKAIIMPHTRIYPGHSYGQQPGQLFSFLLKDNIYLQFSDKESFSAFRLRKGQNKSNMIKFR